MPSGPIPSKVPFMLSRSEWTSRNQSHALVLFSLFASKKSRKQILSLLSSIIVPCKVCIESKPNTSQDRGFIGALPIASLVNEILYVDFIQMDEFNGQDYVMTIVDGLSMFSQFVQCRKSITGEQAVKMLFKEWIMKFGKTNEVCSDNDVRFTSTQGWWQGFVNSLQIKGDF